MDYLTYQQLMFNGISKFSHQPAITSLEKNKTMTYQELQDWVEQIAGYLYRSGAKVGVNVALIIPNSIESALFSLAVCRCGATLVPLNSKLGVQEVDFILNNAEPEIVVTATEKHIGPVLAYYQKSDNKTIIGLPDFIENPYPDAFHVFDWADRTVIYESLPAAAPDDIARISYTGGTTGTPKGVMHTQRNLVAEMKTACMEYPYDDQDNVLFCTPTVHSAGVLMNRSFLSGSHIYIAKPFNPSNFLQTAEERVKQGYFGSDRE